MNPLVAPEPFARDARTALSVNVNKIALPAQFAHARRAQRGGAVAHRAVLAGAQGITVHPRPDERHIRARTCTSWPRCCASGPHVEYNIEGNPTHNLMQFVRELQAAPMHAWCPTAPNSSPPTTAGICLPTLQRLRPLVAEARALGVRVSLFMDPLPEAMAHAAELGADRVELYTEAYAARARHTRAGCACWRVMPRAAQAAQAVGLGVNAGHDLNRANLHRFPARRAGCARGVDRPRAGGRRAGARL